MRSLNTTLLFLTILTFAHGAASQSAKSTSENTPIPIDSIIESKMNEAGIVGIGAAIIVNKELVWAKGYGYADKENKKPFTTDTIMNIGSIAKNFTGVCLMRAVEGNKVSLDEDINKYLPFKIINPYFPDEKITLRNLTTHTSSLADRYPFYEETYVYGRGDATEDLGDFLKNYFEPSGKYYSKENFLNHKPGTYYQYSNIPSALAGYIVEVATGKKLSQCGKEHIFKPLKMKSTGWALSEINLANHTKLYDKKGETLKSIPLYSFPTYPEGGIRTSVSDLAKYFIALLNDGEYKGVRILKKESVREMQRLHFTDSNKPENINLAEVNSGIFWATKKDVTRIGHAGSDPGIKAEMLSDLNKEVAVILFTNTGLTVKDLIKYHFGIFDELYGYGVKLKEAKKPAQH
jgi:CubicO group peptidase (beta-lactamase class C family)